MTFAQVSPFAAAILLTGCPIVTSPNFAVNQPCMSGDGVWAPCQPISPDAGPVGTVPWPGDVEGASE